MKKSPARALAALALALALIAQSAVTAGPALAHGGDPNYRSTVHGVVPPALGEGIEVRVLDFDADIELRNESGEEVLVRGYEGEPYVRIAPDGTVEVNRRSPAYYLNQDRYAQVEVPDSADPEAPPEWQEVDRSGEFTWHDHRSHYMGQGTAPQVKDESKRTKVFDYEIPIEVGGRPAKLEGTLVWVGRDGGFPVAPFIGLAVVVALAAGLLWARRRRRDREPEQGEPERGEPDGRQAGGGGPDRGGEAW